MSIRVAPKPWATVPTSLGAAVPRKDLGALLVCVPALWRGNLVTGISAVNIGPVGSVHKISVREAGYEVELHPAGGDSGEQAMQFPRTAHASKDWTLIWCGTPSSLTTTNGVLMGRGADGYGQGWSLQLAYRGGNTLRAAYVDSVPSAHIADRAVDGPNTINRHQRVALVKSGSTIKGYDWRARAVTQTTSGNGNLRASLLDLTAAIPLNSEMAQGHNSPALIVAIPRALSNAEVWAILDAPGSVFEPFQQRRFATATEEPDTGLVVLGQIEETGEDSVSGSAAVSLAVTSAIVESSGDTASGITTVAPPDGSVVLAATEGGSDSATGTAAVLIAATLAIQEASGDTAVGTSTSKIHAVMAVLEVGADSVAGNAVLTPLAGAEMAVVEIGEDTAASVATSYVLATCTIQELSQDSGAGLVTVSPITALVTMAAMESAGDAAAGSVVVWVAGEALLVETGQDTFRALELQAVTPKVWNGAEWAVGTFRIWDGTAWRAPTIRLYSDAGWN